MSIHVRNRLVAAQCFQFAAALCLALPLQSARSQVAGRHPDRRFVDQSSPVTTTVRLAGPRTAQPATLGETAIATIGREDGPEHFIFGEIASVGTTRQGTVIVIDRKTEDVRLFDARGQFLQRLGRRGQGPGEFRAPHSLLVTPNDEIWIADMQRRLTVFAPSADGYKLAGTLPVEIGIRSMCFLGDELFVNGVSMSDPYVLRALDASAKQVRAFGKLYSSPNASVNVQFSEGLLICDRENDLIVYASPAMVGEVRAYRRDGRAVWRTTIEGLRSNIISDNDGGGASVQRSPDGAHALVSLNLVPGVGVVLQYGFRMPAQMVAREVGELLNIVLDPKTGAGSLTAASWPRLGALSGSRAIALYEDPAPRIEIRELSKRR